MPFGCHVLKSLPHHIHEDNQDGKFTAYATGSVREVIMCYDMWQLTNMEEVM